MTRTRTFRPAAGLAAAVALAAFTAIGPASAGAAAPAAPALHTYKVTITNLTKGQPLSPPVIATHYGRGELFSAGRAANYGVQQTAENGNPAFLVAGLKTELANGWVADFQKADGPLVPTGTPASAKFGNSVTLTIKAYPGQRISWVSMLGCTNDGFAGIDGALLPTKGRSTNAVVRDYDAGTEVNTEDFADLTPGCQAAIGVHSTMGAAGATASNPDLWEGGVVTRHEGVQGVSDDGLVPSVHGWANPVASFRITDMG